tara:strand:+ start:459 stop:791 length:333 start_codon:yes stop_codon:yes gene_type:complete
MLKLTFDFSNDIKLNSLVKTYYVFYFIPVIGILTLFFYKKRVIQSRMCLIMLGINVLVLISYGLKIYEGNSSFINLVLIVCSIIECILLFVARKAINKDENLVRSIDRIR